MHNHNLLRRRNCIAKEMNTSNALSQYIKAKIQKGDTRKIISTSSELILTIQGTYRLLTVQKDKGRAIVHLLLDLTYKTI